MTPVLVCICGQGGVCPGDCAGALTARSVCEQHGHLSGSNCYRMARGEALADLGAGEINPYDRAAADA